MADLKAIVEELYGHSMVGDFESAEAFLTDDFQIKEPSTLPFAGLYSGKSALRELFPIVMSALGVNNMERGEVMVGKKSVSNKVTMTFADPDTAPVEMMEVFIFRGNKVCEIRPYYFDTNVVLAARDAFKASQN